MFCSFLVIKLSKALFVSIQKLKRLTWTLCFLSSTVSAISSDTLTIYATNFEPYTVIERYEIRGVFVDLIKLAAQKYNLAYRLQEAPFARALSNVVANHESTALVAVGRLPKREQQLTWLQLWLPMKLVYFTQSKVIADIDEAKALKRICVRRKSSMDMHLVNMGFKNIVSVNNEQQCALMLSKSRVEAWFTLDVIGKYNFKILNLNNQILTESSISHSFDMYFGVSKSTPQSIKKQWEKALNSVIAEGELQAFSEKYYQGF